LPIEHVPSAYPPAANPDGRASVEGLMLQTALCRGWAGAGQ
jgi:hypothetical protein